jgi:hypothetical protein
MIPKILGAQRDFSAGELDVEIKRADDNPVMKTGARQMVNWRILNSRAVKQRPGKSAQFSGSGPRIEPILMYPGQRFYIVFGVGYLRVHNAVGTIVFDTLPGAYPWTANTAGAITYIITALKIYIFYADGFPTNTPQILTWDGVSQTSTWTVSSFAEAVTAGGQKRTLFSRISPQGITMLPSATTGTINITFSSAVLVAGMVGTRMRFCNRQIQIATVVNGTSGTATVIEPLPPGQVLTLSSSTGTFNLGDEVTGATSTAVGIVTVVAATITVQLLQSNNSVAVFAAETIVGPSGSAVVSGVATTTPQAVAIWDDEVMNTFRGFPSSVFFDQSRLGICNFPVVPSAIAWSALNTPNDFYVGPLPKNAIFNFAPGNVQVQHVVAGMESSEFVFCDTHIFYIPITPSIPLVPGNVNFNELAGHGSVAGVQPRRSEQSIVYMKAGGGAVGVVQALGSFNRPYIVDTMSELHSHLFTASPAIAIAIPSSVTQFEENYIYIALQNGTTVVGRYEMKQGLIEAGADGKPRIGWSLWNGGGSVLWTAALQDLVVFTTNYTIATFIEIMDPQQYLDMAIPVNNLPPALVPPGGKGPLYAFRGGSVTLMDQGYRMMGTYQIDANGFIVPQGLGGENLASATLTAGQPWTSTLEPFVADASPGQSVGQRMFKRRVARFAAYVSQSSGFVMARLFSGPLTRTSPALGTVMNNYRIPAWNQDDDATKPPPLREEAQRSRPLGRSFDPRVAIIKDTPGPLVIHELGTEVTI